MVTEPEVPSVDPSLLVRTVRAMELEDVATVKEGGDPHVVQVMRDYLAQFCAPIFEIETRNGEEIKQHFCPACGERFTGLMASLGIGVVIEWGVGHGEGHCSNCRWPYRGHHFIYDPKEVAQAEGKKVEPLMTVHNMFLAYLPRFVSAAWKPPGGESSHV